MNVAACGVLLRPRGTVFFFCQLKKGVHVCTPYLSSALSILEST